MKKMLFAALAAALAMTGAALADEPTLPDYLNGERLGKIVCDNGGTTVSLYKGPGWLLGEVFSRSSGQTLIILQTPSDQFHFIKDAASTKTKSPEFPEFDGILAKAAPKARAWLMEEPNDCQETAL